MENPNSLLKIPKTDFYCFKKIEYEFLKKRYRQFCMERKKILYDESVLVKKNSRSQILGDLNAKGSIISGITLALTTKGNRYNLLWICKLQEN